MAKKRGRKRDELRQQIDQFINTAYLQQRAARKPDPILTPQEIAEVLIRRAGGLAALLLTPAQVQIALDQYVVRRADIALKDKKHRFIIRADGNRVSYWDATIQDHENQHYIKDESIDYDLMQLEIDRTVIKFLKSQQRTSRHKITPRMFEAEIKEIWESFGRTPPDLFDSVV